jgi:DNA-directed RNA polymerase specialized sigma24 family protein
VNDTARRPRSDDEFRLFYGGLRNRMVALVSALAGDMIPDPEQAAENGWHRFYPHWAKCPAPEVYLRKCVVSEVRDQQRAMLKTPQTTAVGISEEDFAAAVPGSRLLRDQRPAGPPPGREPSDPELAAALTSLSDEQRAVLVLAHELEEERRPAEVAQILGISRPNASMRLLRAHAQLRRILPDGYLEERHERLRAAWNLEERPAP